MQPNYKTFLQGNHPGIRMKRLLNAMIDLKIIYVYLNAVVSKPIVNIQEIIGLRETLMSLSDLSVLRKLIMFTNNE